MNATCFVVSLRQRVGTQIMERNELASPTQSPFFQRTRFIGLLTKQRAKQRRSPVLSSCVRSGLVARSTKAKHSVRKVLRSTGYSCSWHAYEHVPLRTTATTRDGWALFVAEVRAGTRIRTTHDGERTPARQMSPQVFIFVEHVTLAKERVWLTINTCKFIYVYVGVQIAPDRTHALAGVPARYALPRLHRYFFLTTPFPS
jgi:hypothetical protein